MDRMRLNDGGVVPNFIGQALRGEELTVYGDGSQTRSFCYVSDEVEGIYRLMMSDYTLPVNKATPHFMRYRGSRYFGLRSVRVCAAYPSFVKPFLKVLAHTPSFVKTFPKFFGNPKEHTILEFAQIILKMIGGGSKIVFKELLVDDPKQRRPDITKAWKLLKWKPEISLENGLEETIKYFKDILSIDVCSKAK